MKSTTRMFAVFAAAALVASPAFAQSGAQTPAQQQQQPRTPDQNRADQDRPDEARMGTMARGQLVKVDTEKKVFTLRDATGKTTDYKYDDDTKVTGSQRGVAGLATMSGQTVTIHFREQGMDKIASDISVQATDTPSARPGSTDRNPSAPGQQPRTPGQQPATPDQQPRTPGQQPNQPATPDSNPGR